jgi:hypothetical protein
LGFAKSAEDLWDKSSKISARCDVLLDVSPCLNILLKDIQTFGGLAIYHRITGFRPIALRPGLATGLPLSSLMQISYNNFT